MPQLARRIGRAKPSAIMLVAEKAKQLKADGRDIISFSIGVPNFLPGDHVYAAARDALAKDSGQYGSNRGSDALLDAFLAHIREVGLDGYTRANVATGIGAKHVIYNICEALLDEGDGFAFATPYWTSYLDIAEILDADIQLLPCPAAQDYKLTPAQLDAALAKKPRVFLFNNPSQPDRHGLFARRDLRARGRHREVSRDLGHHRRHLQPHGLRRPRLPQFRARAPGAARPRDLHRLAVEDLRHAGLARRLHGRAGSRGEGRDDDEFQPHHQHARKWSPPRPSPRCRGRRTFR